MVLASKPVASVMRLMPQASAIDSLTREGVSAHLDGEIVLIGKAEIFGDGTVAPLSEPMREAIAKLREGGRTSMVVRRGARDLGAIGLMDTPRAVAKDALARLRALGIRRMIVISGDHQKVAEAVARQVGIDEAWGGLMPEDKVEAPRKSRGNHIARIKSSSVFSHSQGQTRRSSHVRDMGFTLDSRRIAASQRTDASGQLRNKVAVIGTAPGLSLSPSSAPFVWRKTNALLESATERGF